jgi:circadian clock protein KaiC
MTKRVEIKKLLTGVPGLDAVLGGGIPELSFNLIAGGPGCGKTTLAHQIMFATATVERPALYITILGEPPLKMLRYQQQYSFFDTSKVPTCIQFLHLGGELLEHGLAAVLESIVKEVEVTDPKLVFVDSFRSLVRKSAEPGQMDLQGFVQQLSLHLTGWEATTFLIGEYAEREADCNPVFTIADGILWLSQVTSRNSIVRKLQVVKLRGQGARPGLHPMKISGAGVRVFPRLPDLERSAVPPPAPHRRQQTGIAGLDDMLGGGIPVEYAMLVVGPSGSGKTILATQFIREGILQGERGVIAVFDKRPDEYLRAVPGTDELEQLVADGMLKLLCLRSLDLSVDEALEELATVVRELGATRVVIDSLMGFELALAPSFRDDFRESLCRMVGVLVDLGVTVLMIAELVESYGESRLFPHGISFLADGIIFQRYVELKGELCRVLAVAKLRGFDHDKMLRLYDIGPDGIVMGEPLGEHAGILVGGPGWTSRDDHEA